MITIYAAIFIFGAFSNAFEAYKKNDFSTTQKILEQKQVDAPLSPLINYNLGNTYYKQKKYDAAKQSFFRAAKHSFVSDASLHEKATFNLANTLYKNTLTMLPKNWEHEKLDDALKKRAITEVSQSIESYKNVLSKNKENEFAKQNKTVAEELLRKLQNQKQDKQKQDDQNKKQDQQKDKQDKQKQDDKKQDQKQEQKSKQAQQKPKSMEERRMEVVLSKIDKHEEKLQKQILQKKSSIQAKPKNEYQKSW